MSAHQYSEEECRNLFLAHISDMLDYVLNEARAKTAADKMDLLIHSVLVVLDGESMLPAFELRPVPHPDDAAYCEAEGSNWWPTGVNICDGSLHDRWINRKNWTGNGSRTADRNSRDR